METYDHQDYVIVQKQGTLIVFGRKNNTQWIREWEKEVMEVAEEGT